MARSILPKSFGSSLATTWRSPASGCGVDIALQVSGDFDRWTATPSGEDEQGPVNELDIWNCIIKGARQSNFSTAELSRLEGGAVEPTAFEDLAAASNLLWSVSGADARVRSLLPQLDGFRVITAKSDKTGDIVPRLQISKELGGRIELKYDGALDESNDHIVDLEYRLSDTARLGGRWRSLSDLPLGDFGLDLRFRWKFD